MPLHGQVKFVPSIRNWFSLVPEPNAETVVTVPLDGEVGETPGAALIESNMLDRRVGIDGRSSGPKRVLNPLSRASMREPAPSTDERFRGPRQLQDSRSLDGGACPDADVLFVRGCEPLKRDLEHVRAWRESRKAKLPSLVGGLGRRSTNQRRGADAHDRTRKDATTTVLDGADECARQALRPRGRRNQDESRGSQQELSPSPSSRRSAVSGEPHVTLPSRLESRPGRHRIPARFRS